MMGTTNDKGPRHKWCVLGLWYMSFFQLIIHLYYLVTKFLGYNEINVHEDLPNDDLQWKWLTPLQSDRMRHGGWKSMSVWWNVDGSTVTERWTEWWWRIALIGGVSPSSRSILRSYGWWAKVSALALLNTSAKLWYSLRMWKDQVLCQRWKQNWWRWTRRCWRDGV